MATKAERYRSAAERSGPKRAPRTNKAKPGGGDGDLQRRHQRERVMFTRKTARYVRFVALSEINGNPWASVAELRMVGGSP